MVTWVQNSDTASPNNTGYGLIGAFAFVYIGLAVRRLAENPDLDHG